MIRPCTVADVDRLALVGAASFLETFAGVLDGPAVVAHCASAHSAERYRELLAEDYSLWLAEEGSAPVGYAMVGPTTLAVSRPGDIELKRIYVLHRFHGSGVGPALLQAAVDYANAGGCPRLLVGAYAGNAKAQAFYVKNGFQRVGERRFQVGQQTYQDFVFAKSL